ncbi:MAG: metallophosphoesterase family protein [Bacteroidota bacterium]|nr:metallophosphoesterase family protein [Bacteroidota bacterium]
MKQIGLLSDTHGFIDERLFTFFENCDEIWHAGDIGNIATAGILGGFKTLKAVHGNIDGYEVRLQYKSMIRFTCEDVDVLMTHIGGYPGHYDFVVNEILKDKAPKLFISGHSHILKVMYDKHFNLLHINPGAAGNSGFHKVKTAVRFVIDGSEIKNMEIWESPRG